LQNGTVGLPLPLNLPGIGLLEFDRIRAAAESGCGASIESVREWAATEPWSGVRR